MAQAKTPPKLPVGADCLYEHDEGILYAAKVTEVIEGNKRHVVVFLPPNHPWGTITARHSVPLGKGGHTIREP